MNQLKRTQPLPHSPFLELGVEEVGGKGEPELKVSRDITNFFK